LDVEYVGRVCTAADWSVVRQQRIEGGGVQSDVVDSGSWVIANNIEGMRVINVDGCVWGDCGNLGRELGVVALGV
jgi:hypothetical protein